MTERSEQYKPDESRTATLDLKDRKRGKGGVPYADFEDDRNLGPGGMDPGAYEKDGVGATHTHTISYLLL